jgi:hypothetical protein
VKIFKVRDMRIRDRIIATVIEVEDRNESGIVEKKNKYTANT